MNANNHKITNYDAVLDERFGKEGTAQRIQAEEDALAFYSEDVTSKPSNEKGNNGGGG